MSSGSTFLRESESYVLASCAFTKLKNHKCPIHITPAARCVQRKMTFSHSFMESPGWSETTARTLPSADRSVERRTARDGRLRSPMPAAAALPADVESIRPRARPADLVAVPGEQ